MWESCEIEERDFSLKREAEQESFDDDVDSKADGGESFDLPKGLPSESNSSSNTSPSKQQQQQKKKQPSYRKFGSLIKKSIGNQRKRTQSRALVRGKWG
ncbi:hypothetical protein Ancab_009555 [Ancistrocladus abbreviatus]